MASIEFTLNGENWRLKIYEGESLLETLRNRCGILSTKEGCQPQGHCGCWIPEIALQAKRLLDRNPDPSMPSAANVAMPCR